MIQRNVGEEFIKKKVNFLRHVVQFSDNRIIARISSKFVCPAKSRKEGCNRGTSAKL